MNIAYPACFYKETDSDAYTVTFPDVPECITYGSSVEEALTMAEEALALVLVDYVEDGKDLPAASYIDDVDPKFNASDDFDLSRSFVSYVGIDVEGELRKLSKKTIRKNITLPAWVNTWGEAKNINFSQTLQDAIIRLMEK